MTNKYRLLKKIRNTSIVVLGIFIFESKSDHAIDRLITSIFCKKLSPNLAQSIFGESYIVIGNDIYISKVRYRSSETEGVSNEKSVNLTGLVDINSFVKARVEQNQIYFRDIKHEYVFHDIESSQFIVAYPK
jgi:hypothetical protein